VRLRSDRRKKARLDELAGLLMFVETSTQLGEFTTAEELLARADRIAADLGDPSLQAECEYRRALLETERGNPSKAAEHFDRAAHLTQNPAQAVRALHNVGLSELQTGRLADAAKTFERLIEVAAGDPLARAHGHLGLARVAMARNEYEEAARQLDEATRARPDAKSVIAVEIALQRGMLSAAVGDLEAAQAAYDEAQAIVDSPGSLTEDEWLRASAAIESNRLALAVRGETLRPDDDRGPGRPGGTPVDVETAEDALIAGSAALERGDTGEAKRTLLPVYRYAEGHAYPELTFKVGVALATAYLGGFMVEPAHRTLASAIDALEQVRYAAGDERLRVSYVRDKADVYGIMVQVCLFLGELRQRSASGEALEYVERAKSRTLLEALGPTTPLPVPDAVPEQLRRREADLLTKLRTDAEAHSEYDALLTELAELAPEYVALRRGAPASVAELRAVLHEGSGPAVCVEYLVVEDATLVLGLRADWSEPEVVEVPLGRDELRGYVERELGAYDKLRALDVGRFHELLGPLVHPLAEWSAPGEAVWLVPHDGLHYVPLHALPVDGLPLTRRNPVVYTPNGSVMRYCQEKRTHRPRRAAIVVGDSRGDLPFAREEAGVVGDTLGSAPIVGAQATRTRILSALAEEEPRDVVHVACHGYFDPDDALRSGVVLAAAGGGDVLTAGEIFGLELHTDVVVLSACESGINAQRPGDDLLGLTRALIYAGTPSVIVTLWRVDDLSTLLLMRHFYRSLDGGLDKAGALRAAQIELMGLDAQDVVSYVEDRVATLVARGEREQARAFRDLAYSSLLAAEAQVPREEMSRGGRSRTRPRGRRTSSSAIGTRSRRRAS
jgi:tetratricopeptide (TPR) repeat protein